MRDEIRQAAERLFKLPHDHRDPPRPGFAKFEAIAAELRAAEERGCKEMKKKIANWVFDNMPSDAILAHSGQHRVAVALRLAILNLPDRDGQ